MEWFIEWFISFISSYGYHVFSWMFIFMVVAIAMCWKQIFIPLPKTRTAIILGCIIIVALIVRLLVPWGMELSGETSDYLGYSLHFMESGELAFDRHPPGYIFLLSFLMSAFGLGYHGLIASSIVLGLISIFLAFSVSRDINRDEESGIASSIILAFHFIFILSSVVVWRDIGVIFFSLLSLLLWSRLIKGKDVSIPFILSFFFMALMDVRSLIIILPLVLMWREARRTIRPIIALAAALLLFCPFLFSLIIDDSGERDLYIYGGDAQYHGLFSLRYIPVTLPLIAHTLLAPSMVPLLLAAIASIAILFRDRTFLFLPTGLIISFLSIITFWGLYFFKGTTDYSLFLIFMALLVGSFFRRYISSFRPAVKAIAFIVLFIFLFVKISPDDRGTIYPRIASEDMPLLIMKGECECTLTLSEFFSFAMPDQEFIVHRVGANLPNPPFRVVRFDERFLSRPEWIDDQRRLFESLEDSFSVSKERTVSIHHIYLVTHTDHMGS